MSPSSVRKARAIIFPEPGRAVFDEVALPEPGPQDVIVEVEYSSISIGTERWCLKRQLAIPEQPPMEFPHAPGYQAAGIVREVGKAVHGIRSGDRVFSRNCRCPAGWKGSWWGGHVSTHVADQSGVLALPDSVTSREGSGLLLAQVGYNGAMKPRIAPGDVAAVIGDGLVGQYAAQVLRFRGARVIMSGLSPHRLEIARRYSADEVFDARDGDFVAYVRERHPSGVAVALDTASSARTVRQASEVLRHSGDLILNGFYPPPENCIDWHWLRNKELTVHCPNSRTRERLQETLDLIRQGSVHVDELVTHELPVEQAPRAYDMLLNGGDSYLGIVFRWTTGN